MSSIRPNSHFSRDSSNQSPPVAVNVRAVGSTVVAAGAVSASSSAIRVLSTEVPPAESSSRTISNPQNPRNTASHSRPVTVRVLGGPAAYTGPSLAEEKVNFNVKIFNPENKKEQHVFVLRDVTQAMMASPETLIQVLRRQFGSHVHKRHQFPIGYMRGSLKISIRTPADISDVWLRASKGESVVLWCEGTGYHAGNDSDDETPSKRHKKRRKASVLEEKNERIEDIVQSLRKKHDGRYTSIQYRLWAEMIDIGTHRYYWCLDKHTCMTFELFT